MQNTVDSLDVTVDDGRNVVQSGQTDVVLIKGIDAEGAHADAAARLHRGPRCGRTVEVDLQVLLTREVEACDVVTERVGHQVHLRHHVEAVPSGVLLDAVVLQLGLRDEVRLVVIETIQIGVHAVVHRCEAGVLSICAHILVEAAFLEDTVEGAQFGAVAQQFGDGLLVG